ncbi:heme exporter protein CcmD [Nitrosomonas marina]|uniref:Heme exporter protein D n=1 Tax=Nitrosomonas marina TaxID=917 RepID=A0A1I0EPJ3_9PROT|nr:heme exporter protein CcmD [Nitrosomonas marina]SET47427.1 heme exporter protein CcmD [Nitrosomonas marina]
MNWSSWSEFFSMGGYGVYVWGSYFVTFVCIIGEILLISKRRRTLINKYGQIYESNKETYSVPEDGSKLDNTKTNEQEISDTRTNKNSNKEEISNETTS